MCFPGRLMTKFPQYLPVPIMVHHDLWIFMALDTHMGTVIDAQEWFSHWKISTRIGTHINSLSGKHLSSSGIKKFGDSTMKKEGTELGGSIE